MIKDVSEIDARGIEIDLTGPNGNAFVLIGLAKQLARKLDFDGDAIAKEMRQSDYENLVAVFEKHFGSFVTIYR